MARAVKNVIGKIVRKKEQQPCPPLISNGEDGKAVDSAKGRKRNGLGRHTQNYIADAHAQTGGGVFQFVEFAAHDGVRDDLRSEQQEKARNRQMDEVVHRGYFSGIAPVRRLRTNTYP